MNYIVDGFRFLPSNVLRHRFGRFLVIAALLPISSWGATTPDNIERLLIEQMTAIRSLPGLTAEYRVDFAGLDADDILKSARNPQSATNITKRHTSWKTLLKTNGPRFVYIVSPSNLQEKQPRWEPLGSTCYQLAVRKDRYEYWDGKALWLMNGQADSFSGVTFNLNKKKSPPSVRPSIVDGELRAPEILMPFSPLGISNGTPNSGDWPQWNELWNVDRIRKKIQACNINDIDANDSVITFRAMVSTSFSQSGGWWFSLRKSQESGLFLIEAITREPPQSNGPKAPPLCSFQYRFVPSPTGTMVPIMSERKHISPGVSWTITLTNLRVEATDDATIGIDPSIAKSIWDLSAAMEVEPSR